LFLDDGRVCVSNNAAERGLRGIAITRKNLLFAGSAGGGRTWASIATMLQTCKMNGVDPYAWTQQALERIANRWPNKNIEALMPWNLKPTE
jgi:transposase